MIVGAEGDMTRDPRSKMQRGFDSGNDTRGNWPEFRAIPPIELSPIENSIAFSTLMSIYLIIRFPRFYLTVLNNVSR